MSSISLIIIHATFHPLTMSVNYILFVIMTMLMACNTSSAPKTAIDPSCIQGHWYYFDVNSATDEIDYYEMVFNKEGQYAVFLEFAGWYVDMPYEIKKDSLLLGNVTMSKYVMLSCNCDQVVLAQ